MPQVNQTPQSGPILAADIRVGTHLVIPMAVNVETVTSVYVERGYAHITTDATDPDGGYMWLASDIVRAVPSRTVSEDDGEVR